ncbi:N-alpha-acetyltransferase 38, NatC auxiliary subunit isoform X4 [Paramisgurnus dabryanus]|uniref:N-alpha-acetyltransferase 38, NatC auxiliary subunit isoform X4 n=1 Tax=Paramisgurnus dabryanus TaxID=90735 RepID=UPI003CCFDDD9
MATESEENGTEMQPEVEDSSYSLARLKLENLLNKSMTIRMTDGRTLVGLFLCTDRDCNVILGSAQEFLKSTGYVEKPVLGGDLLKMTTASQVPRGDCFSHFLLGKLNYSRESSQR